MRSGIFLDEQEMEAERASETTFSELIRAGVLEIGDGYRVTLAELGGSGLIFLRAGQISDQGISFVGVDRFKHDLGNTLRSKTSKPADAIVTTKGNSVGRTAYVTAEMPQFVYSPHLSFWRSLDPTRLVPGFLRYWAKGMEFKSQLDGMKASTDMAPYLSLSDQRRLRITLPTQPEQSRTAAILEALDHKIELDREMNTTLETMAHALFRSWFTEFDPVIAKGAGRVPLGLNPQVAVLFPESFVNSDVGPIPVGWRHDSVYQIADVVYGAAFGSRLFNREGRGLPLLRIRDLGTHSPEVFTDEVHPKGTCVTAGRIVVGMDGEFRAHVWRGPESWMNQRVCAFRPRPGIPASFVYHSIVGPLAEIERGEVGTTVSHLGKADIDRIRILIPNAGVLDAFGDIATPLLNRTLANAVETRLLTVLRDTLLPKLLSGQIRVREAEKVVERLGA